MKRDLSKLPKTKKERVRDWRDKKLNEGSKSITIWINSDIANKMEELIDRNVCKNRTALVATAISELYDAVLQEIKKS